MTSTTRTWSVEETLAESEALADYFESVDLSQHPAYPAADYWLMCAAQRAAATANPDHDRIRELVADARSAGSSWERIAELLGITVETAQERYSDADNAAQAEPRLAGG